MEINRRDIESLRGNTAWQWLNEEWRAFLTELEQTLVTQDYPEVYRTQGRVSVFMRVLTSLDELEEEIKNGIE